MSEPLSDQPLVIRRAVKADEAALAALARRLGELELPPWRTGGEIAEADLRAMTAAIDAGQPDNEVFVAERRAGPAGCLHVNEATDFFGRRHAHLSVLATTAAAERSGVGRALIAHAETWARERGLLLLTLNVFAANARARRVYEQAGFVPEMLKFAKPL